MRPTVVAARFRNFVLLDSHGLNLRTEGASTPLELPNRMWEPVTRQMGCRTRVNPRESAKIGDFAISASTFTATWADRITYPAKWPVLQKVAHQRLAWVLFRGPCVVPGQGLLLRFGDNRVWRGPGLLKELRLVK